MRDDGDNSLKNMATASSAHSVAPPSKVAVERFPPQPLQQRCRRSSSCGGGHWMQQGQGLEVEESWPHSSSLTMEGRSEGSYSTTSAKGAPLGPARSLQLTVRGMRPELLVRSPLGRRSKEPAAAALGPAAAAAAAGVFRAPRSSAAASNGEENVKGCCC